MLHLFSSDIKKDSLYVMLGILVLIHGALAIYGNAWGGPFTLNIDEDVLTVLKMFRSKSIFTGDTYHPSFYRYVLSFFFSFYFLFLKITGFDFSLLKNISSWAEFVQQFPILASQIYIVARCVSAFWGCMTIIVVFFLGMALRNTTVGILAACILSITQGFVAVNHFAKTTALVNFLGILFVYLCVLAIQNHKFKWLNWAALVSGLALATKFNAGLLIVPLALTFMILLWHFKKDWKQVCVLQEIGVCAICLLGICLGWPDFFMYIDLQYTLNFYGDFFYKTEHIISFWIGLLNYGIQLLIIFGVPFGGIVLYSIFYNIKDLFFYFSWPWLIVYVVITLNLIFVGSLQMDIAYTKFIIFIVPLLAISAADVLDKIRKLFPIQWCFWVCLCLFYGYSAFYCLEVDSQFLKRDIRYNVTHWILNHVPQGSSVGHFQQYAWLYQPHKLLHYYQMHYFDKEYQNDPDNFFDLVGGIKAEQFFKKLNDTRKGPEYLLFFSDFIDYESRYNKLDSIPGQTERKKFIFHLLKNSTHYVLIKKFIADNYKIPSKRIPGLSYPRYFWHSPVYDAYIPTVIFIFKKRT